MKGQDWNPHLSDLKPGIQCQNDLVCLPSERTMSEISPEPGHWAWHGLSAQYVFVPWRIESGMCGNMDRWMDRQMEKQCIIRRLDGHIGKRMDGKKGGREET